jgi:cytochrome P450
MFKTADIPPGPRAWIPFQFLRAMQYDSIRFLEKQWAKYGDTVHFKVGPQPIYFFEHPDHVREVLVTHDRSFHKGLVLQRTKIVLGEGLLTSEEELHKRQRRLIQPAFHRDRISGYAALMVERAA